MAFARKKSFYADDTVRLAEMIPGYNVARLFGRAENVLSDVDAALADHFYN